MVSSRVISYPEHTSPAKIPIAEQEGHTHVLVIHFKISSQSVFCFVFFFFSTMSLKYQHPSLSALRCSLSVVVPVV